MRFPFLKYFGTQRSDMSSRSSSLRSRKIGTLRRNFVSLTIDSPALEGCFPLQSRGDEKTRLGLLLVLGDAEIIPFGRSRLRAGPDSGDVRILPSDHARPGNRLAFPGLFAASFLLLLPFLAGALLGSFLLCRSGLFRH